MKNFALETKKIGRNVIFWDLIVIYSVTYLNAILTEIVKNSNFKNNKADFFLVFSLPLIWIYNLTSINAWRSSSIFSLKNQYVQLSKVALRTLLSFTFMAYMIKDQISRYFTLSSVFFTFLFLLISRKLIDLKTIRRNSDFDHNLIYLGCKSNFEYMSDALEHLEVNKNLVHIIEDSENLLDDITRLLKKKSSNYVYVSKEYMLRQDQINQLAHLHEVGVSRVFIESKLLSLTGKLSIVPGQGFLEIHKPRITDSGIVAKRLFDISFSAVMIILLSPIMILISVLVKITSRGSILYVAERIGQDNKIFRFPKFRTMYANSDKIRDQVLGLNQDEILEKYKKDARITPVGKFLRRWSLDELPQFFSVLIGTMSVVGPRPILVEELELVPENDRYRFICKPGLTGLWQVSGRKEVTWTDRMAQDISYIENWTFAFDLMLVLRTIKSIVTGKGAF